MELPVFVVHGAVVWKVLLGLMVSGAFGVVALRRRARERRTAASEVRVRLNDVTKLEPGVVVLRGTLAAGTASTSQQDIKEPVHERSAELTLDLGGQKIAIEGPVTVERGTQTSTRWLKKIRTHTVRAGDEVVLGGTAVRRAEDDAGYRDSGVGWEVGRDVYVIAVYPQARPKPMGLAKTLALVAVFGMVGYGALRFVGSRAMKKADDWDRDDAKVSLSNSDAVAIAAAMPGSRAEALEELSRQLERGFEKSDRVFELRLALDEVRGECRAFTLFSATRLEETVPAARACGETVLASQALAFLGKYEEAWNEPGRDKRPVVEGLLAIGAGRWREAAAAADARAVEYETSKRTQYYTDQNARTETLSMRCLGALFRTWAGDKPAFDAIAGRETHDRCRVFAAIALPEAERSAALAAITFTQERDYDLQNLVAELRKATDPAMRWRDGYYNTIADIVGFGMNESIWFAPAQLALGRTDLGQREQSSLLGLNAGLRAFRGDLAGARKLIDQQTAAEPDGHYRYSNELALGLLDPTARLPDGPGYVHPGIDEMVTLRKGKIPEDVEYLLTGAFSGDCKARLLSGVKSAQAGDGAELAEVFRRCHVYWNSTQKALLAVMPLVTKHREELAEAVRWFRNDSTTYSLGYIPFRFLENIAWYRNLAAAIRDTEQVATWQAIFDRHANLLDDRQKLIAFWMWNE